MSTTPRTAQEMYDFCNKFGLGHGTSKKWDLMHFQLIVDALSPGEYVLTVFEGLHNYKSVSQHDKHFAYAVTNKRFILAQKRVVGSVLQTISLKNVNDITLKKGLVSSIVTIDTIKETFNVMVADAKTAEKICRNVHSVLDMVSNSTHSANQQGSMASQLVELKKLLDSGIITQKDFEIKKKQILGI